MHVSLVSRNLLFQDNSFVEFLSSNQISQPQLEVRIVLLLAFNDLFQGLKFVLFGANQAEIEFPSLDLDLRMIFLKFKSLIFTDNKLDLPYSSFSPFKNDNNNINIFKTDDSVIKSSTETNDPNDDEVSTTSHLLKIEILDHDQAIMEFVSHTPKNARYLIFNHKKFIFIYTLLLLLLLLLLFIIIIFRITLSIDNLAL